MGRFTLLWAVHQKKQLNNILQLRSNADSVKLWGIEPHNLTVLTSPPTRGYNGAKKISQPSTIVYGWVVRDLRLTAWEPMPKKYRQALNPINDPLGVIDNSKRLACIFLGNFLRLIFSS